LCGFHALAQSPVAAGAAKMGPMPKLWKLPLVALLVCAFASAAVQAACADAPKAAVDWTGCEKHRLILRKAELQGARMAGADLNGTDLEQAKLVGADLSRASVDRVRLEGADLSRAKMVQLSGYRANFSKAKLVGADLTKAELARSNLAGADLSGANLGKAELQRVSLEAAVLTGANLAGADLARANLQGAKVGGAQLGEARLFRARIEGVNLSAALGLTQAQLHSACGDQKTVLPKGLQTPRNWPCSKDD